MDERIEVRLDSELASGLEEYVKRRKITKSIAIRAAIIKMLKERGYYYAIHAST